MNWKNYSDVYDLYINGTKVLRLWGKKHAINIANKESNTIFEGHRHIELVNTETGEIIYNT